MKSLLKNFFTLKPKRFPEISRKRSLAGSLAILTTQLLDVLTTWYGLTYTDAVEANPIMAPVVSASIVNFIVIKLSATALLIWYSWQRPKAPWIIAIFYLLVVINNIYIITL